MMDCYFTQTPSSLQLRLNQPKLAGSHKKQIKFEHRIPNFLDIFSKISSMMNLKFKRSAGMLDIVRAKLNQVRIFKHI